MARGDIKYASIYDSFTITVVIEVEDLGFCAKGEGGRFVADGNLISGVGKLPWNTDGGGLCNNHPANRGGMTKIIEAVRQFRGEAHPAVQVKTATSRSRMAPAAGSAAGTARPRSFWSGSEAHAGRTALPCPAGEHRQHPVLRRSRKSAFFGPAVHGLRRVPLVSPPVLPVLRRRHQLGGPPPATARSTASRSCAEPRHPMRSPT